jgi:hypothetical protein
MGFLLVLRSPAGQGGRLPDPRRHLRFVEFVLVDIDVAHVLVLGLARGDRTERRTAEKGHLDVVREAMEVEEPALALDAVEWRVPSDGLARAGDVRMMSASRRCPRSRFQPGIAAI